MIGYEFRDEKLVAEVLEFAVFLIIAGAFTILPLLAGGVLAL